MLDADKVSEPNCSKSSPRGSANLHRSVTVHEVGRLTACCRVLRLRDLIWIPALLRTGPGFRDRELGEVLLPALAPFSFRQADDALKLGRATEWKEVDGETVPFGQKMLLIDDEEEPILELRHLEFQPA